MQIAYGEDNLRRNELNLVFGEAAHVLQVVEQLPAVDIVHYEVYPIVLLEHVVHFDNERVLYTEHNDFLQLNVFYQVFFY